MKTPENIFEYMFNNNVCFSIGVSYETAKLKSIKLHRKEYFYLVRKNDIPSKLLKSLKESLKKGLLLQIDLSDNEIDFFKSKMDLFKKVIHNDSGIIYELKNNSFKKYIKDISFKGLN